MRQKAQHRMAEVGQSVNMTSYLGVSFHSDKKRENKRMGKRRCMESDHSHTAYRIRMPQPQAAYAYRVYGILAYASWFWPMSMCKTYVYLVLSSAICRAVMLHFHEIPIVNETNSTAVIAT